MNIKQELLKAGEEELKKICQPKLSFSATMANILAIPEFAPIRNQFKLGNFIRVGIRDGYVKRARLLEVQINLDDLSDFSCTFGDLVTTRDEISKHAELLQQAVTVSKSVAANKSHWQKGANKATELDQKINDGLSSATLEVGRANGQNIVWNEQGIWGRKLVDGTTDQFEDEQFRIVNNRILFSDDGFRSSKGLFGKFEIDGVTHWGVLSDAVVSGFIEGSTIRGGNLRIGDGSNNYFQVDESGNVSIVQAGKEKYASTSALDNIKNAYKYRIELSYTGNTIFNTAADSCKVTCKVWDENDDITDDLPNTTVFNWYLNGALYKTTTVPEIEIGTGDFVGSTQLNCKVIFDETLL